MSFINSDMIDTDGNLYADLRSLNYSGPVCEMFENKGQIDLYMELPGVDPDQISIDVEYGRLVISGLKNSRGAKGMATKISEVYSGQFRRSFDLPEDVNLDKIEAEHNNGVLNIKVPKRKDQ